MVELSNFSDSSNMSYTLVNGIKIVYLYGKAGPEEPNLYDIIRVYAFENNLASEDSVGRHLNFTLLRKFFRRIEEMTGFKHLDFEGAWDRTPRSLQSSLSCEGACADGRGGDRED